MPPPIVLADSEDRLERARALLAIAPAKDASGPALGAAALAAASALMLAGVMIAGPGVQFEDPPIGRTAP